MKILLSIKPEFALKIFDGSKKYEYRRAIFKRTDVEKALVYASAPISKVIGEFEIADIIHDNTNLLWNKTNKCSGISRRGFFKYFSDKNYGYAIRVKNYILYEKPLPLEKFTVSSPPQSFMYIE